jgi:hypothetical protein
MVTTAAMPPVQTGAVGVATQVAMMAAQPVAAGLAWQLA